MSARKRSRPNPKPSEDAGSTASSVGAPPATRSGPASRPASSLIAAASDPAPPTLASTAMSPSRGEDDKRPHGTIPAAEKTPNKQVRKSRSWYNSWPRPPKSSASTQLTQDNVMGGTSKPTAAPDFSRYETKKAPEGALIPETPSNKPLVQIAETESTPNHTGSSSAAVSDESSAGSLKQSQNGDTNMTDTPVDGQQSSTSESTVVQRPSTSSGWLGWLGKSSGQETSAAEPTKTEDAASNEDKTAQEENPEESSTQPADARARPETPSKPSSSWLGLFSITPANPAKGETEAADTTHSNETEDVVMTDAPPAAKPAAPPTQPSAGSTWAFWSKDPGPKQSGKTTLLPEQGELAVIGEGSEASPRRSVSLEVKDTPIAKDPPLKTASSKNNKRSRPKSIDIDPPTPERPSTPQSDTSVVKSGPPKGITSPESSKTEAPSLLLPSFGNTYSLKENPSIIKQIAQFLLRTQQPAANHVYRIRDTPKVKKAIAIGVHGLFPAAYLRPMIGQPVGTSIRFANHCAEAIRRWADSHGCSDCEIEKVALEGDGKIGERVENLWKLLLNWIDHIRSADLIILACHSQGVPVGIMLLAKLIELGIVSHARIGVCAMAGVSLGPFPEYKSSMGMLMGSAAELWQFGDPESDMSKRLEQAVLTVIDHGARITYVGSIDDQLVPLESAIYSPVSHPYIYRAVYIDGRVHASDFIAHLVGFALKLRNLGISDHGLIRELSLALAGSLYSGAGHSRLYDEEQIYDLAVFHALETTSVSGVACRIEKYQGLASTNPYMLPWIMRGLLEEEFVRTELYSETEELLKQFDAWQPTTKALKDVKYRLEAVRSKL